MVRLFILTLVFCAQGSDSAAGAGELVCLRGSAINQIRHHQIRHHRKDRNHASARQRHLEGLDNAAG